MNLSVKKMISIFVSFFLLSGRICLPDNFNPVYQIAAATTLSGATVLPSLQNSPGNNLVVNALVATATVGSSNAQSSLTITGDVSFNGDIMTILLPTSISDLQVVGGISIKIPVGGSLNIYIGGVLQPIPSQINVSYTNPANTFGINTSVNVYGGFILFSSSNIVSIQGSLSVAGTLIGSRIAVAGGAYLNVVEDIIFREGTVSIRGNVTSYSGNIFMIDNMNIVGNFGVDSSGIISASKNNSISFIGNSSTSSYGVYIQSGIMQAGTINFENNSGINAGVQIDGDLYTNAFNATINCTSSTQDLVLNTVIHEYENHSVPLSSSQINIHNIGCQFGTLSIIGDIAFNGNNVSITVGSLADISVANFVVLNLPVGGVLKINGVPYQGNVFGLSVTYGQNPNTFLVNGNVETSTMLVQGVVTIDTGLTTTGTITMSSGSLTLPVGAVNFHAGGNIVISNSTALLLDSTLTTCEIVGDITGSGAITINADLNMPGSITATSFSSGASNILVNGGLTAAGNIVVNDGLLSIYGAGLHVTGGNLTVGAGAGINVGSGGLSISTSGNIIIEDNAASFYSGGVIIDSGDFTLGSGVASFNISGGNLNVGGSGVVTLNSSGTIGNILTSTSLIVGANITISGVIFVTGGSMTINSGVTLTASGIAYDGNSNPGTFFNSSGRLNTDGGISIQNAINNGIAVLTGIINAGGNLTISNNQSSVAASFAVLISENISGVDVRIDMNSCDVNSNAVFNNGYNISAFGLLSISNNSSVAGGTAVFINGGNISAGSTITITDNNAGSGSSVGAYMRPDMITTVSTLTMNNNIGTVYGVRIPAGVTLRIGNTSSPSVILSGFSTNQNIQSLSTFYNSLGTTALSVIGGSIVENASGGCVITLTGNS